MIYTIFKYMDCFVFVRFQGGKKMFIGICGSKSFVLFFHRFLFDVWIKLEYRYRIFNDSFTYRVKFENIH